MKRAAQIVMFLGATIALGVAVAPEASAAAGPGGPANCTGYSASNFQGSIPQFATAPHAGGPSEVGLLSRTSCGSR